MTIGQMHANETVVVANDNIRSDGDRLVLAEPADDFTCLSVVTYRRQRCSSCAQRETGRWQVHNGRVVEM
jgi:hypothetical protein